MNRQAIIEVLTLTADGARAAGNEAGAEEILSHAETVRSFAQWLDCPTEAGAVQSMTSDMRESVSRQLLSQMASSTNLSPNEIQALASDPHFLSRVEYDAIRRAAELSGLAERSLLLQGLAAHESGLYAYHPGEHGSVDDYLREALDGVERGTTNHHYISVLHQNFVPWAKRQDKNADHLSMLWRPGAISKSRHLVDAIGHLLQAYGADSDLTPEQDQLIDRMLADLADPDVSERTYREKYSNSDNRGSGMPAILAYDYMQSADSGVVVMVYTDRAQRKFIETAMGKKGDFHSGTGQESILTVLNRIRERHQVKKPATRRKTR